jgi:hypothetical protein
LSTGPSQDGTYSHHLSMANLPHIEGRHLATTCGGQRFSSRLKRCHLVLPFKRGARPVRAIKPRRPVAPFRNTVLALSGHLSPSHSPLARFRSPLDRGNACARPSTLRRFCCVAAPLFFAESHPERNTSEHPRNNLVDHCASARRPPYVKRGTKTAAREPKASRTIPAHYCIHRLNPPIRHPTLMAKFLPVGSRGWLRKAGTEWPRAIDESAPRYKERVRKLAPLQYADESSWASSSVSDEQLRRRHIDCFQRTRASHKPPFTCVFGRTFRRRLRPATSHPIIKDEGLSS